MIYIVTYATHSERYFELLKQSCPDIIILGDGKPWNGFSDKVEATIEFCKSKKPEDIICFVDGFDSVILSSKEEILEKYRSFNIPLVFSEAATASTIMVKYLQDKIFGKCKDDRLNSGLFIGTAKSIIDFWEDIQFMEDDQVYATHKCNKITYMKIDKEHKIFYNYAPADTINVKNNALFINNNKIATSIISCPGNNNINHILSQLNYKNLPDIQYDFKYRITTYGKHFIDEILLAILIVGIFIYFKNIPFSIRLSFVIFCLFLEYELFIKHIDVTNINKFLYLMIDFMHVFITFFILYFLVNFECNIQKLLILNIFYFIIIACFFYFKRCVITIISNNLINKTNSPWTPPYDRFVYFFDINRSYEKKCSENKNTSEIWMNGNLTVITIVILLNIYCLWKINTGSSCIPKSGYGKIDFIKAFRNIFK